MKHFSKRRVIVVSIWVPRYVLRCRSVNPMFQFVWALIQLFQMFPLFAVSTFNFYHSPCVIFSYWSYLINLTSQMIHPIILRCLPFYCSMYYCLTANFIRSLYCFIQILTCNWICVWARVRWLSNLFPNIYHLLNSWATSLQRTYRSKSRALLFYWILWRRRLKRTYNRRKSARTPKSIICFKTQLLQFYKV